MAGLVKRGTVENTGAVCGADGGTAFIEAWAGGGSACRASGEVLTGIALTLLVILPLVVVAIHKTGRWLFPEPFLADLELHS